MANQNQQSPFAQGPFSNQLTQPYVPPQNPAAQAGFGGVGSGIMQFATNFLQGASQARLNKQIEAEKSNERNLQTFMLLRSEAEKAQLDPDSDEVKELQSTWEKRLAEQVAGADDGSGGKTKGGNPIFNAIKGFASNMVGGPLPKKAQPITTEEIGEYFKKLHSLPRLQDSKNKAYKNLIGEMTRYFQEANDAGVPPSQDGMNADQGVMRALQETVRFGPLPQQFAGLFSSASREEMQAFRGAQQFRKDFNSASGVEMPEADQPPVAQAAQNMGAAEVQRVESEDAYLQQSQGEQTPTVSTPDTDPAAVAQVAQLAGRAATAPPSTPPVTDGSKEQFLGKPMQFTDLTWKHLNSGRRPPDEYFLQNKKTGENIAVMDYGGGIAFEKTSYRPLIGNPTANGWENRGASYQRPGLGLKSQWISDADGRNILGVVNPSTGTVTVARDADGNKVYASIRSTVKFIQVEGEDGTKTLREIVVPPIFNPPPQQGKPGAQSGQEPPKPPAVARAATPPVQQVAQTTGAAAATQSAPVPAPAAQHNNPYAAAAPAAQPAATDAAAPTPTNAAPKAPAAQGRVVRQGVGNLEKSGDLESVLLGEKKVQDVLPAGQRNLFRIQHQGSERFKTWRIPSDQQVKYLNGLKTSADLLDQMERYAVIVEKDGPKAWLDPKASALKKNIDMMATLLKDMVGQVGALAVQEIGWMRGAVPNIFDELIRRGSSVAGVREMKDSIKRQTERFYGGMPAEQRIAIGGRYGLQQYFGTTAPEQTPTRSSGGGFELK